MKNYTVTYNPCSPTLSVPPAIYTIDPAWSACGLGMKGLFDPPIFLTPGPMFGPATKTGVIPLPVAGQTITPGIAPVTATTRHPQLESAAPSSKLVHSALPPSQDGVPDENHQSKSGDPSVVANLVLTLTIGSATLVEDPSSAFTIGSQILRPGGQITYLNTVYSLASNGESLIVGGTRTQSLAHSSSWTKNGQASSTAGLNKDISAGERRCRSDFLIELPVIAAILYILIS